LPGGAQGFDVLFAFDDPDLVSAGGKQFWQPIGN
jgi:hypothetical protein